MNKFINEAKNDMVDGILKNRTKDINKDNVVTKAAIEEKKFKDEGYSIDLTSEFTDIPIDWIAFRPENEYSIQSIRDLAENIWELGLLQPLIVYSGSVEKDKKYTLSDGERRFRALNLCREKAIANNDKKNIERFNYAKCRILTGDMRKNEEAVHHAANKSRINTIFEIIARYKPQEADIYFGDTDTNTNRKGYVERKFGKDGWNKYKNNELLVKFNQGDVISDIYLKFQKDYPQYQITIDTVKKYFQVIVKLIPESIKAINNENYNIGFTEAKQLSSLEANCQLSVIKELELNNNFKEVISKYIVDKDKSSGEEDSDKEIDDGKYIIKVGKTYINSISSFSRIDSIKQKELNGNQKEYLKQIKKIQKEIEKLSGMPTK